MFYAHTSNHGKEPLEDHLLLTETLAKKYGEKFNSENLCALIARLHDIGKRTEKFQNVLAGKEHGIDHAIVGAWYLYNEACENKDAFTSDRFIQFLCCAVIRGHHSQLWGQFTRTEWDDLELPEEDEYDDPLYPIGKRPALRDDEEYEDIVNYVKNNKFITKLGIDDYLSISPENKEARMLYIRMIFSCLVDADYTATAAFDENKVTQIKRQEDNRLDYDTLLDKLNKYRNTILLNAKNSKDENLPINMLRNQVYEDANANSNGPVGFYTMTAPTGTAKTLALIKFALEHAKTHKLDRIIIVLPYLSIITQNANEYKKAFGNDIILEDDSNTEYTDEIKLLADRWDSPIIITTSVKFFETLCGNKPVPLRKLHRIASACVVFDECQTLPHDLTTCTIKTLQGLPKYFNTTILFSTATLPIYKYRRNLEDLQTREVIRNVAELYEKYDKLKETEIITVEKPIDYEVLWNNFENADQVLIVFNTVRKALTMYEYVTSQTNRENVFYLSADLSSEHKLEVIDEIKNRIKENRPCVLISTQCIEAGVDLDFANGAREYAPLPSVVQTAGRINRNGKHPGKFIVFGLEDQTYPNITYRNEAEVTKYLAQKYNGLQLNSLELMDEYYKQIYYGDREAGEDSLEIRDACKYADIQDLAEHYCLIDDMSQITVIVPYKKLQKEFNDLQHELYESDYCITKAQMKISKKFQVTRYASKKNLDLLQTHCHQLYMRGSQGKKIKINWMIADMDNIYDAKTGLWRDDCSDPLII